jgi:hypothetical protein
LAGASLTGCLGSTVPSNARPPVADKWFRRASDEFRSAKVDAAHDSIRKALDLVPADEEVRLLGARVALARLEFAEAVRLLKGMKSTQASALRGRAHWYEGDLERAADELEALLADPEVTDPWAKSVVKLARRGAGRRPFEVSGGLLAQVDMVRADSWVPFFVVPVEIDGDKALAMVSTGTAEVVLDSATRDEPSWVSLRFGGRIEVKDVPALTQDLTGISRQLGAPVKALLGANLLRHLNVTIDRRGRQFVVRSFVPPAPPVASRVDLYYLRGGGMIMGSTFGEDQPASLYVDSSMLYPVALDRGGWKRIGIEAGSLPMAAKGGGPMVRGGAIPLLHFGSFKLPQVTGVYGAPIERLEKEFDIDVDGAVGAGLLADFRLTFSDNGRVLWVEQPTPLASLGGKPLGPAGPLPPGMGSPGGLPPGGLAPGDLLPGGLPQGPLTPGGFGGPGGESPPVDLPALPPGGSKGTQ